MAQLRATSGDWPSAVVSLDCTLRRLRERLVSAEADLRLARECYDTLLEASRACLAPVGAQARASLTVQEQRVAGLVAAGMSNQEVALALNVSVHTVKSHVKKVLEKLALRSRWQLAAESAAASPTSEI